MTDDEARTCHDCGDEIDGWDLTVKVFREETDFDAVYYHSDCYSNRDAIARQIEKGEFDGI